MGLKVCKSKVAWCEMLYSVCFGTCHFVQIGMLVEIQGGMFWLVNE